MTFRYARHTNNLEAVVKFYTDVLGFRLLGDFKNHDNYDGVFIGKPNLDWHLEFTSSNEKAIHTVDADDLLVFYFDTTKDIVDIIHKARELNIPQVSPKNPYWLKHGKQLMDPDGFGVILTLKQ